MSQDQRRILEIDRTKATPSQEKVLKEVDKWAGRGATPFKIWLHCPELAEGMEVIASHFKTSDAVSLSEGEAELVILSTTVFWNIPYAIANHVRHARSAGLDEAALEKIVAKQPASFADPRLQAVSDFTAASLGGGVVSDEVFQEADAALGRRGIAEILILIGYYTSVSLGLRAHNV